MGPPRIEVQHLVLRSDRMNRSSSSIAFALALAACGGPRPPEEAPHTAPATPPLGSSSAAPAAQSAGSSHGPADTLLGKPCSEPKVPQERCRLCDGHDRIAGVVIPGDFLRLHGDKTIFRRSPDTSDTSPHRLVFTMAASAETLWAQVLTCPDCRRELGWAVALSFAALRDLSPGLRGDLQAALGFPAAPLLDGAAAFRAAAAADPTREGVACPGGVRR
jgi:hypothetical protein